MAGSYDFTAPASIRQPDLRTQVSCHAVGRAGTGLSDGPGVDHFNRQVLAAMGAQALFGYTPAEVIGRPVTLLALFDRQHEAERSLTTIRRGEHVPYHETVRLRKDGQPIDIRVTVVPVRGENGAVIGAVGIARDVTGQRRVEREVRDSRDRLELALRASNTGLFDLDLRTGIARITPEYALMLGYDATLNEIPVER
jgi:PAS domain S-box-containing protein